MSGLISANDALAFINGISACVNRSVDLDVVIADVDDVLQRYMVINGACLYLLDDEGSLQLRWSRGFRPEFATQPDVRTLHHMSHGANAALSEQSVQFVSWSDEYSPGSFADLITREGMRPPIWIPILAHGRVFGLLGLTRRMNNRAYDEAEMKPLLEFLGRELGMACSLSLTDSQIYAKLREFESRWQYVYDEAPVAYLALDSEGRVLNCNDAILLMFGHQAEDIVGLHISRLLPGYSQRLLAARTVKEKPSQRLQFEDTIKDESGQCREVSVLWRPLVGLSGAEVGAYVIIEDITERNRLESENLYKSLLVENSADGMFVRDLGTGLIVYANEAAWITRGYTRDEFFSLTPDQLTAEDYVSGLRDLHQEFLRNGGIRKMIPQACKDGSVMDAEVTTRLLEHRGKRLVIVLIHDVTERNRLQMELQQAHRLESLGRLAAGVAHDFNNMLAGILGHASMAKSGISNDDPVYGSLDVIEKTASRAAQLVSQLVTFAKGGKPRLQQVDLNEVARDVAGILVGIVRDDTEIILNLDPDLPPVQADETQITQCLLNMCINARDAMPNGGLMTIKTKKSYIDEAGVQAYAKLLTPGIYAGIRVKDSGIGMDDETQKRIFEPFFTTKADSGGAGFGLAITYGIVRSHKGYIDVRSRKGEGSAFTVYLPATSETIRIQREVGEKPSPDQKGTILVVEDDETVRDFVRIALSKAGYSVLLAEDGESALDVVKNGLPELDLVILDMIMPGMNGKATFENLRAIGLDVPVLISSGYSDDEYTVEGVSGYLQKPYRVRELLKAVSAHLSTSG